MAKFEIGKEYTPYAPEFDAVRVIARTTKTIRVKTEWAEWTMRVRIDENGNEFAVDSKAPRAWRDAFVYYA